MFETVVALHSGRKVYQHRLDSVVIDFVPKGRQLVITFEAARAVNDPYDDGRDGWGMEALLGEGYSVMAVKPRADDWYRGADLHAFLSGAAFGAFARRFDSRLFYGSSMGGYAALALSAAVPGSMVFAIAPQTSQDPSIVPWDTRFRFRRGGTWDGDFADARDSTASARRVYVAYDPFEPCDRAHAQRLNGDNIEHLRVPFGGHPCAALLARQHILLPVIEHILRGDRGFFPKLIRARRRDGLYIANLASRLRDPERRYRLYKKAWTVDPSTVVAAYEVMKYSDAENLYEDVLAIIKPFKDVDFVARLEIQAMFLMAARAYLLTGDGAAAQGLIEVLSVSPLCEAPIIADLVAALIPSGGENLVAILRQGAGQANLDPAPLSVAPPAMVETRAPSAMSFPEAVGLEVWLDAKRLELNAG